MALETAGYDVDALDSGCCGMAGSFGYEAEHYDLSTAIGSLLREKLEASAAPDSASGRSRPNGEATVVDDSGSSPDLLTVTGDSAINSPSGSEFLTEQGERVATDPITTARLYENRDDEEPIATVSAETPLDGSGIGWRGGTDDGNNERWDNAEILN
jgi:hypothetical protein